MNRIEALQQKITRLKDLLSHLEKTIVDKDTKEFLLRTPKNSIDDVERYLLPQGIRARAARNADMWLRAVDLQLQWAERNLKHAQDAVAKYGATLRVTG